jgi:hypothetical protein
MSLPFSTTSTIAITLLAIIIPLFILAVSLLGNAIERAKEEKTKAEEQERKDTEVRINDIENKIKEAKETGKTDELGTELGKLKRTKKETEAKIKRIQKKYSLLEFKKCVLYPGGFFILAIILNEVAQIYFKFSTVFWVGSILGIVSGSYRLCKCLMLAQEVAVTSEEFQTRRLIEAFRKALNLHEEAKLIELGLQFRYVTFPYTCKKNTEIEFHFRVALLRGTMGRNIRVWFFVPDGFGLISPPEATSWRQPEDFVIPNIRTVIINIGDLTQGVHAARTIRLRSPNISGEYLLIYNLVAEAYFKDRQQVNIIVTD